MVKLLLKLLGEARGNATWDVIRLWVWPLMLTIATGLAGWFKNAPMWEVWLAVGIVCVISYGMAFLINQRPKKNSVEAPKIRTEQEQLAEDIKEIAKRNFPAHYTKVVTVQRAIWRASEGVLFDATKIVKGYITNGKLEMRCTIDVLGDPHPDLGKTLEIEYWYDGKCFTRMFREGEIARLP